MLCQNEEEAKFNRPVAMFKGSVWLKTARGGDRYEDSKAFIISSLGDYEQFLMLTFSRVSDSLQNHRAD